MDNNQGIAPDEAVGTAEGQANDEAVNSQPESSQGGELIAGKFKTQEELEKAYQEAQKALTEKSQKIKETEKTLTQKLNTIVSKIADEQGLSVDQVLNYVQEEADDNGTTIESEVRELKTKLAERDLIDAYPEAKENIDLIRSVASSKGITLEEALEEPSIKRVLELSKKSAIPSVVESTNKIARDDSERHKKINALRTGNLSDKDIGKLILGGK